MPTACRSLSEIKLLFHDETLFYCRRFRHIDSLSFVEYKNPQIACFVQQGRTKEICEKPERETAFVQKQEETEIK
jgi:hypothetical protein